MVCEPGVPIGARKLNRRLLTVLEVVLAAVASALLVRHTALGIDYAGFCGAKLCDDPAAPIAGLAHGHFGPFVHKQPTMGPLSILLRAPFAALAQFANDSALDQYRFGAFACLFATGLGGIWLGHAAGRRGAPTPLAVLLAVGILINPLTFRALSLGHPEEPLTAVMAVIAIVLASERKLLASGLLFGAAVATKQWALLAGGPILLVSLPSAWRTVAAAAAAVVVLLYLPLVAGDFHRTRLAFEEASSPHAVATPTNVWWKLTDVATDQPTDNGVARRVPPAVVERLAHWLVLAIAIASTAWLVLRARNRDIALALGLAATLFLLRCLLDPYTFSYHHWPFLVACACYEVIGRRRVPAIAIFSAAALWWMSHSLSLRTDADSLHFSYLAWTLPVLALLVWQVHRLSARPC